MNFLTRPEVAARFRGQSVAIVGSGPGSLRNDPGLVDSHDLVVRVNNYKLSRSAGKRTDVFYSFFGSSIKKTSTDLKRDGVKLCIAKCPNAKPIESEWHRLHGKEGGVDFRPIYRRRSVWWFCDTYVPSVDEFLEGFRLLGDRVPTTGFAAILFVLSCEPKSVFLTGFDFFRSGIHNVNEPWRVKRENADDPIGHVPELELAWLAQNASRFPISTDPVLTKAMASVIGRAA